MKVNVNTGNLEVLALDGHLDKGYLNKVISKNTEKLQRLFRKLDASSIRIEFHLKYDEKNKIYKTILIVNTPKSSYHITVKEFSLEGSISKSINNLKRKFIRDKERRIDLHRKRN